MTVINRSLDELKHLTVPHAHPIRGACGHKTYLTHRGTGACLECYLIVRQELQRRRALKSQPQPTRPSNS